MSGFRRPSRPGGRLRTGGSAPLLFESACATKCFSRDRRGHVSPVPFTLGTEVLQNIAVGDQQFRELYGHRFRQNSWIFDSRLHVHVAEIAAVKSLLNPQRLTLRMSEAVQPVDVVESRRIHHQRIAVPFSRRVSHPRRKRIHRKFAPVCVDLAKGAVHLIKNGNSFRSLIRF